MTAENSFKNHVEYLSTGLRKKYDLVVEEVVGDKDGDVFLKNDLVRIRLFPGWPRDPYVEASSVSYSDPTILGNSKYFELWRYIDYVDAWQFFPTRWPEGKANLSPNHNRSYSFIGSPFQVLEIFVFLAACGDPILKGDREKLGAFMKWMRKRDLEYTLRMSKSKKN